MIDDHRTFADSLARVFDDHDDLAFVAWVPTRAAAVADLPALSPDVVVVAHRLPDGDGVGTARRLREVLPGVRAVVLAVHDGRTLAQAIDAGCTGFVTRERPVRELLTAIRTVARGDAYVPADLLADVVAAGGVAAAARGFGITRRELEVLACAAAGRSNAAIAAELGLQVNTVRNHMQAVITKLGAHSKLEAVTIALRARLIDVHDP